MYDREHEVESKFCHAVNAAGGWALKFTSPSLRGMPDRVVLRTGGHVFFVELKRKGAKPRPLQGHYLSLLRRFGFHTYVIDDAEGIKDCIAREFGGAAHE